MNENERTLVHRLLLVLGIACLPTGYSQAQDLSNQERSLDIELVRPGFSTDDVLGVDSPIIADEGEFRVGLLMQYEKSPLRLVSFNDLQGPVINHRHALHLGLSYAPSRRFSARVVMPFAFHWGNQIEEWNGDGVGLGDLQAGVRFQFGTWKGLSLGIHGDLFLPFSTRDSFMGEELPRTQFGLLASYTQGPITVLTDIGPALRATVDNSNQDFLLGNELVWNTGMRYALPDEKLSVTGAILIRGGFKKFFTGAAENSMEWLAGASYRPTRAIQLDAGLGRGITQGYGTTGIRLMTGVSFYHVARPRLEDEPEFNVAFSDIPDDEPEIIISDPDPTPEIPPKEWQEGQLARLEQERIVIRDPIQFELNTANILPESLPTLQAVADLLNANDRIGHPIGCLFQVGDCDHDSWSHVVDVDAETAPAVLTHNWDGEG